MRVFIVGANMPDIPEVSELIDVVYIVCADEPSADLVEWAADNSASVTLITTSASSVDDETLESVAAVIEDPDPVLFACSLVIPGGDVAVMRWTDTDDDYLTLQRFLAAGADVLDANDGFTIMEIGNTPDLHHLVDIITRRVTKEVLKTIRAEIKDTLTSRRFRSSGKKA